MLTELTIIAAGRCMSDDCGDLRRWSETGISFEGQVEELKGRAKRSRRLQRVIEGRMIYMPSISVENAKICAQRQRCLITEPFLAVESDIFSNVGW
jgi:hypothetical protein